MTLIAKKATIMSVICSYFNKLSQYNARCSYLEEVLYGVSMVVVGQSERGRLKLWNAGRNVACQTEDVHVMIIEHGRHA